jgi:hypothetical protein
MYGWRSLFLFVFDRVLLLLAATGSAAGYCSWHALRGSGLVTVFFVLLVFFSKRCVFVSLRVSV